MLPPSLLENLNELSSKEKKVLETLVKGFSNRDIALELGVCEKTVEKHLTSIYKKLEVSSRSEAIVWVISQSRDFPQ